MTPDPIKKRVIVVLGMHRSGTSALTRGLQTLGIHLGDNLIAGLPENNEKGFWEDAEINTLNNEILQSFGKTWNSCELSHSQSLDKFKLTALNLIRRKITDHYTFGLKDPRMCRLLPFWQEVFSHINLDVRYVIAVRNPLSVAESLSKRDQIDSKKSYILWFEHQLLAIRNTKGYQRVVVNYDALLERPLSQLKRLSTLLELAEPNIESIRDYENTFLEKELRHSTYQLQDLDLVTDIPPTAVSLYRILMDAAHADSSEVAEAWLKEAAELELGARDFPIALKYIDECEERISAANLNKLKLENEITEQAAKIAHLDDCEEQVIIASSDKLKLGKDIAEQAAKIAEQAARIAHLDNCERQVHVISAENGELEKRTAEQAAEISRLSDAIQFLESERAALTTNIASLQGESRLLRDQQEQLTAKLGVITSTLAIMKNSNSWRITAPIRALRRLISGSVDIRYYAVKVLRPIWHAIPLYVSHKQKLKHKIFSLYQKTLPAQSASISVPSDQQVTHVAPIAEGNTPSLYVPRKSATFLESAPVRLIAFYLPQFHAIKENNEWWGEGFTEWTNVRPAKPLYQGHYQPHVPHPDIGYYNLLNVDAQRKQIELAKEYGVGGFCFYFYWFAGERLLESPTLSYLQNKDLDLPFCLCWANENWSRRWDGLDSEILIGQDHTPEDDIAFISYLSKYLKDERYIKIDGKPLVLVYRPSLLPDATATAMRWRQWCKDNGVGEIYLAYTQSFEATDPSKYGFDAAIEFPPNNSAPPDLTASVSPVVGDFAGKVYDWSVFTKRSKQYKHTDYKLYRSVCPSWDNTARRKSKSISFVNSSPCGYQEWLCDAVKETLNQATSPDENLVFVNAWNEWAEGAHLEPDMRYGYAYLEATRLAMTRSSAQLLASNPIPEGTPLAVIIHCFYPEILVEILSLLEKSSEREIFLYVTTTEDKIEQTVEILGKFDFEHKIIKVANRGRDILPFLIAAKQAIADGFELILKVHTKKSLHRQDGEAWRQELYEGLLSRQAISQAMAHFANDPSIGIATPADHIVDMSCYWGANAERVKGISLRLGVESPEQLSFAAGTMFFMKTSAVLPLLELAFSDEDFETEQGQVDGTLAHAIERAFAVSAASVNLRIAALGNSSNSQDYPFAERTISQ